MSCLIVVCTMPDQESAVQMAQVLVEERLAACVNVLAPCQSVYRWQGQIEQAQEVPLLIKTRRASYTGLEAKIVALHPYDTPEIIALPVDAGLPAYLRWVEEACNSRGMMSGVE